MASCRSVQFGLGRQLLTGRRRGMYHRRVERKAALNRLALQFLEAFLDFRHVFAHKQRFRGALQQHGQRFTSIGCRHFPSGARDAARILSTGHVELNVTKAPRERRLFIPALGVTVCMNKYARMAARLCGKRVNGKALAALLR